jgi:hypothetical protein
VNAAKRKRQAARAEASRSVGRATQHLRASLNFHAEKVDTVFALGKQALKKGEYPLGVALADSFALALDCYGELFKCLSACLETAPSEFDQMSEMAGPLIMPSATSPTAALVPVLPVPFQGAAGGAVPSQNVRIRRLPDGSLHVVLMNLDPALPATAFSAEVGSPSTDVTFTKVLRDRLPLAIQYGDIPAYLLNDPALQLHQLLFQ